MQLQRGQKLQLQQLGLSNELIITIQLNASFEIDLSCFGLDENQKLKNEDYMVFYNQPRNPDGSVEWQPARQQFIFKLNQANLAQAQRFMICAAIDHVTANMSHITTGKMLIQDTSQKLVAEFDLDAKLFSQEKAVMLAEVYFKDVWRLGIVAQGFNGGLAALVEHFGGEVAQPPESQQSAQTIPPSIPAQPKSTLNLSKIQLEKTGQSHRINLDKSNNEYLRIEAIWVDNGDGYDNNDDLDLRVAMLEEGYHHMEYIWAPDHRGSLNNYPYVWHEGDVQSASSDEPGKETVLVNPEIAKNLGNKVALVFSVYSAVSNGKVAIASLQPKMRMQYGNQIVECVFNPSVSPLAKKNNVYTYVIGVAMIDQNGITLQHSGLTSKPDSEATPRIIWGKNGAIDIRVDGPSMFKNE